MRQALTQGKVELEVHNKACDVLYTAELSLEVVWHDRGDKRPLVKRFNVFVDSFKTYSENAKVSIYCSVTTRASGTTWRCYLKNSKSSLKSESLSTYAQERRCLTCNGTSVQMSNLKHALHDAVEALSKVTDALSDENSGEGLKDAPLVVEVESRQVFGRELYYPVNQTAELLCRLIERKVFRATEIAVLKDLGYIIKVRSPDVSIK